MMQINDMGMKNDLISQFLLVVYMTYIIVAY